MAGHGKNSILTQFYVLFLVIASAAFMVTIYHCIVIIWRKRQHRANSEQQATVLRHTDIRSSIESSICQLIPTHKHEKCKGSHDAECPVCLSEFEDGEELRTLPECLHSFHVACIDMWLHSHPNCPVCRTNATPSPSPQVRFDFRMSQDLGIQRMAV